MGTLYWESTCLYIGNPEKREFFLTHFVFCPVRPKDSKLFLEFGASRILTELKWFA